MESSLLTTWSPTNVIFPVFLLRLLVELPCDKVHLLLLGEHFPLRGLHDLVPFLHEELFCLVWPRLLRHFLASAVMFAKEQDSRERKLVLASEARRIYRESMNDERTECG